ADGSRLPRHSGVDDRPLAANTIAWQSPASLRVELKCADGAPITGTGLRRGITAIVGGGFHGKSTLLDALRLGIYAHVPGDGREQVITDPTAVAIRAEDSRSVCGVDLSTFIGPLPFDRSTDHFTSDDASGATSQAAAIVEALELDCRLLLIDEDTAATNFMIRDARMRQLITPEREPITPFIDRARQLADEGVSTILVTGGSSDYLGVADTVIAMDEYRPVDVSARAHELVPPTRAPTDPLPNRPCRIPGPSSIDPRKGRRERSATAKGVHVVEIGRQHIDLMALTQLVDSSQTRALAQALLYAHDHHIDGTRDLADICSTVVDEVEAAGLDALCPGRHDGNLASFRRFELAATLNRLRTLQIDASPGAPA
ncbi:MAG: ATPase, partial [Gemmatimonadetes bacterium]|nr:ATPase [Gemmatimonadota bacterium]